jgi:L-amino acid N-acyltransferase YncA
MRNILVDNQKRVLAWMARKVDAPFFSADAKAIGWEAGGVLIGGVVFELWSGPNIYMHVAVEDGAVVTRKDLRIAFAYPFQHLNCKRITGLVRADNLKAQRFDEHLGFRLEGRMRQAAADGTDMLVYGMLSDECRWLGVKNGALAHN